MGTNILIRGTVTGGVENAIAQIDVPMNGNLVGIFWCSNVRLDTTDDEANLQLSFGSVFNDTSDSRQVISSVMIGRVAILTAVGGILGQVNVNHPVDLRVAGGERIYMHATSTAAVPGIGRAVMHFDFDLDRTLTRRR